MSTGTTYFWRQDKLEIVDYRVTTEHFHQSSMLKYLYCPCVLDRGGFAYDKHWYGYFGQTENFRFRWEVLGSEKLPEEFRLALLIAGVQL